MSQIYDSHGIAKAGTVSTVDCIGISAGTLSSSLSSVTFADSNGVSFGLNTAGVITASAVGGTGGAISFSAGTSSGTFDNIVFSNGNNVSFGMNGSTVTGSISTSLTNVRISAGTSSTYLSALTFANSNDVSFGLNGSVVTASIASNYLTTAMASNRGSDFIAASAATAGTSASLTLGSAGVSVSVGPYITTARASTDAVGLNAVATNVTWTVNSSGISLNAGGYAGTNTGATNCSVTANTSGISVNLPAYLTTAMSSNRASDFVAASAAFAGTNASGTINSTGISVSVAAGGGDAIRGIAVSGSTASTNTVYFSNANGVSFGFGAAGDSTVLTASHNAATSDHSHGAVSIASQNMGAVAATSASNGLTLGVTGPTPMRVSASNGSFVPITLHFGTENGATFYTTTNNSIVLSYTVPTQTAQTLSVVMTSNTTGNVSGVTVDARSLTLQGRGGVSVGWSTSVGGSSLIIDAAAGAQSNQTLGIYGSSQTTGSASSGTHDARSVSIIGAGIVSVGNHSTSAGGTTTGIIISATQSNQAFSADASSAFQTLVFQDSNGVSFSNNAGSLRVTHGLQFTSATSAITSNAVNTSAARIQGIIGSNATYTSGSVGLRDLNGITWQSTTGQSFQITHGLQYTSATSAITSAALHTSVALRAIYDGANSISTGTIRFTNANGVSFTINGQTISGSVAAQTAQTLSVVMTSNTAGNVSSATVDARSLTLQGRGDVSVGWSTSAGGSSLVVSAPAQSVQPVAASGSNGSFLFSTLQFVTGNGASFYTDATGIRLTYTVPAATVFSNSNNVSFGLNGSTITATATVASTQGSIKVSAGASSASVSALTFSNANGVSFGLSDGTITASAGGGAGVTLSAFRNMPYFLGTTFTLNVSDYTLQLVPFVLPYNLSFNFCRFGHRIIAGPPDTDPGTSTSSVTYTGAASAVLTYNLVLYSRGVGASSNSLQSVASTSAGSTKRVEYTIATNGTQMSSVYRLTYGRSDATTEFVTSASASTASFVVLTSLYSDFTGDRLVDMPWATSLSAGEYWLGIAKDENWDDEGFSAAVGRNITSSHGFHALTVHNAGLRVLGSSNATTVPIFASGLGIWTTNSIGPTTASINFSEISTNASQKVVYFQLLRVT